MPWSADSSPYKQNSSTEVTVQKNLTILRLIFFLTAPSHLICSTNTLVASYVVCPALVSVIPNLRQIAIAPLIVGWEIHLQYKCSLYF